VKIQEALFLISSISLFDIGVMSSNSSRRHTFPHCTSPQPRHAKTQSDPFCHQQRFELMRQKDKLDGAEERRIYEDFQSLKNPKGHQYSDEQNRLLLTLIHGLIMQKGMSESSAITYIADISGSHYDTIQSLYSKWKLTHTIHSPDTSKMGKGNPSHPLYVHPWDINIEQRIHCIIKECNQARGFCNSGDIQSMLKKEFNIDISRNGLARRLHHLGYQWGRTRTMGGMSLSARIARGVTYMKELSLAIEEENSNQAIICFSDESYVNVRHKIQYTWYSIYSPQKNEVGGSNW
jgi:transposase